MTIMRLTSTFWPAAIATRSLSLRTCGGGSAVQRDVRRPAPGRAGEGADQRDLASVKRELATGQKQVAQIYHQAAALANERDELRTCLAATNARLGHSQAAKIQPENTVAALREARGTAIDVVPPNVTMSATYPAPGKVLMGSMGILGRYNCGSTLADLPREKWLRVQGLVADLHSKLDERVDADSAGELLFTVGSDEVQADAYAKLVKLVELICFYHSRQVLIGHSDADGDGDVQQGAVATLAELVKQILVENFDLAADRLSTEGAGGRA